MINSSWICIVDESYLEKVNWDITQTSQMIKKGPTVKTKIRKAVSLDIAYPLLTKTHVHSFLLTAFHGIARARQIANKLLIDIAGTHLEGRIIRSQCFRNKLWSQSWSTNADRKYLSEPALRRRWGLNLKLQDGTQTSQQLPTFIQDIKQVIPS